MAIATRRIVVEGTRHTIALTGKMNRPQTDAVFALFINGILHDKITLNIKQMEFRRYFKHYEWMLNGKLEDEVLIGVKVRTGIFIRPEYSFYVGDQLVHKEKGNWGGI